MGPGMRVEVSLSREVVDWDRLQEKPNELGEAIVAAGMVLLWWVIASQQLLGSSRDDDMNHMAMAQSQSKKRREIIERHWTARHAVDPVKVPDVKIRRGDPYI